MSLEKISNFLINFNKIINAIKVNNISLILL